MRIPCITSLAAALVGAVFAWISPLHADEPAPKPAQPGMDFSGSRGFDFLIGDWRAHHRRISAVTKKWVQFDGAWSCRALMGGAANVEEHSLNSPDGAYRAIALRSYDEKSGKWSIWWLDQRYPGILWPPVRGGFGDLGIGLFYSDSKPGDSTIGRFIWSDITSTSARWQQGSSQDGGTTWTTNWLAELQRQGPDEATAPASTAGSKSDFAFLNGAWRVDHRYLKPEGGAWVEARGTVEHREFTNGWANVDDYVIEAPSGTNRAAALRSYDPQTAQWTIWWLDGRNPSVIDTPMQGRFQNGVGTFYGTTTLKGKSVRVRFIWSDTASPSPNWQQSYSYDDGKTWETVWTMQFRRS